MERTRPFLRGGRGFRRHGGPRLGPNHVGRRDTPNHHQHWDHQFGAVDQHGDYTFEEDIQSEGYDREMCEDGSYSDTVDGPQHQQRRPMLHPHTSDRAPLPGHTGEIAHRGPFSHVHPDNVTDHEDEFIDPMTAGRESGDYNERHVRTAQNPTSRDFDSHSAMSDHDRETFYKEDFNFDDRFHDDKFVDDKQGAIKTGSSRGHGLGDGNRLVSLMDIKPKYTFDLRDKLNKKEPEDEDYRSGYSKGNPGQGNPELPVRRYDESRPSGKLRTDMSRHLSKEQTWDRHKDEMFDGACEWSRDEETLFDDADKYDTDLRQHRDDRHDIEQQHHDTVGQHGSQYKQPGHDNRKRHVRGYSEIHDESVDLYDRKRIKHGDDYEHGHEGHTKGEYVAEKFSDVTAPENDWVYNEYDIQTTGLVERYVERPGANARHADDKVGDKSVTNNERTRGRNTAPRRGLANPSHWRGSLRGNRGSGRSGFDRHTPDSIHNDDFFYSEADTDYRFFGNEAWNKGNNPDLDKRKVDIVHQQQIRKKPVLPYDSERNAHHQITDDTNSKIVPNTNVSEMKLNKNERQFMSKHDESHEEQQLWNEQENQEFCDDLDIVNTYYDQDNIRQRFQENADWQKEHKESIGSFNKGHFRNNKISRQHDIHFPHDIEDHVHELAPGSENSNEHLDNQNTLKLQKNTEKKITEKLKEIRTGDYNMPQNQTNIQQPNWFCNTGPGLLPDPVDVKPNCSAAPPLISDAGTGLHSEEDFGQNWESSEIELQPPAEHGSDGVNPIAMKNLEMAFSQPPMNDSRIGQPRLRHPAMNQLRIRHPLLNQPRMSGQAIRQHGMSVPEFRHHRMSGPSMNVPRMSGPTMDRPEMTGSSMYLPQMGGPAMNRPRMGCPTMNRPEISNPALNQPHVGGPAMNKPDISGTEMHQPNMSGPEMRKQQPEINSLIEPAMTQQGMCQPGQNQQSVSQQVLNQQSVSHTGLNQPSVSQSGVNQPSVSHQPKLNQPSVSQPSLNQPSVGHQLGLNQPSVSQPSLNPPSVSQPGLNQPSVSQPSLNQPFVGLHQPSVSQPSLNRLSVSQPGLNLPSNSQPSLNQPLVSQPGLHQPSVSQPSLNQPSVSQPGLNQPSISQPSLNQPLVSQPGLHQPSVSQPSLNRLSVSQPGLNLPSNSQPSLNQPLVSQPGLHQPSVSQPSLNQPSVSQPGLNQPSISQPILNQPPGSQPGLHQPFNSQAEITRASVSQPGLHQQSVSLPGMIQPSLQPGMFPTSINQSNMNFTPAENMRMSGGMPDYMYNQQSMYQTGYNYMYPHAYNHQDASYAYNQQGLNANPSQLAPNSSADSTSGQQQTANSSSEINQAYYNQVLKNYRMLSTSQNPQQLNKSAQQPFQQAAVFKPFMNQVAMNKPVNPVNLSQKQAGQNVSNVEQTNQQQNKNLSNIANKNQNLNTATSIASQQTSNNVLLKNMNLPNVNVPPPTLTLATTGPITSAARIGPHTPPLRIGPETPPPAPSGPPSILTLDLSHVKPPPDLINFEKKPRISTNENYKNYSDVEDFIENTFKFSHEGILKMTHDDLAKADDFRDELIAEIVHIIANLELSYLTFKKLLNVIREKIKIDFISIEELRKVIDAYPSNFKVIEMVTSDDEDELSQDSSDSTHMPVQIVTKTDMIFCRKHTFLPNYDGKCNCNSLHVCKFYLLNECQETQCRFGHTVKTEHNIQVLKNHGLHRMTVGQLISLLRNKEHINVIAVPGVCRSYNTTRGCNREPEISCQFLHLCKYHLKGRCIRMSCKLGHDPRMPQPFHLLSMYGLKPNNTGVPVISEILTRTVNVMERLAQESEDRMKQDFIRKPANVDSMVTNNSMPTASAAPTSHPVPTADPMQIVGSMSMEGPIPAVGSTCMSATPMPAAGPMSTRGPLQTAGAIPSTGLMTLAGNVGYMPDVSAGKRRSQMFERKSDMKHMKGNSGMRIKFNADPRIDSGVEVVSAQDMPLNFKSKPSTMLPVDVNVERDILADIRPNFGGPTYQRNTNTSNTPNETPVSSPSAPETKSDTKRLEGVPALCKFYNNNRGCRKRDWGPAGICFFMHICHDFVHGFCDDDEDCKRSHDLYSGQPAWILARYGVIVDDLTQAGLASLLDQLKESVGSAPEDTPPITGSVNKIELEELLKVSADEVKSAIRTGNVHKHTGDEEEGDSDSDTELSNIDTDVGELVDEHKDVAIENKQQPNGKHDKDCDKVVIQWKKDAKKEDVVRKDDKRKGDNLKKKEEAGRKTEDLKKKDDWKKTEDLKKKDGYRRTEDLKKEDGRKTEALRKKEDRKKTEDLRNEDRKKTEDLRKEDRKKTEDLRKEDRKKTEDFRKEDRKKTEYLRQEDRKKTEDLRKEDRKKTEELIKEDGTKTEDLRKKVNRLRTEDLKKADRRKLEHFKKEDARKMEYVKMKETEKKKDEKNKDRKDYVKHGTRKIKTNEEINKESTVDLNKQQIKYSGTESQVKLELGSEKNYSKLKNEQVMAGDVTSVKRHAIKDPSREETVGGQHRENIIVTVKQEDNKDVSPRIIETKQPTKNIETMKQTPNVFKSSTDSLKNSSDGNVSGKYPTLIRKKMLKEDTNETKMFLDLIKHSAMKEIGALKGDIIPSKSVKSASVDNKSSIPGNSKLLSGINLTDRQPGKAANVSTELLERTADAKPAKNSDTDATTFVEKHNSEKMVSKTTTNNSEGSTVVKKKVRIVKKIIKVKKVIHKGCTTETVEVISNKDLHQIGATETETKEVIMLEGGKKRIIRKVIRTVKRKKNEPCKGELDPGVKAKPVSNEMNMTVAKTDFAEVEDGEIPG